ncbi:MAG TPA: SDR family NAD(P)-dependent oxidoreductase [Solirubrobacteraceae bacterium]|jgi:NAD(P)-dependent dehydrogenase (short-subunit alcohol dehydrogenase family)|nr:SDR family NAD(P)-dependent oxidoreductase [Solirubrobacteraceae bacterium]
MNLSAVIDTALDRSIVLGYGHLGLGARRRLPDWPTDPPRMDGQVVLVTGAASGLGLAACQGFARLGAGVRALARSQQRAADAVAQITEQVPGADVRPVSCDISSLSALRDFAEGFAAEEPRLDVLVNNAGVMPDERKRSAEGHELTFATHVLAPFALTAWLADLLKQSAPARVINVSSGGMYNQALPDSDFESEHDEYGPKKFYARTKREEVVITEQWAERLDGSGVVVHAMHPGWADTQGVQTALPLFRAMTRPIIRTAEDGADTIVWLGAAPEPLRCSGRFWHDRRMRPTHYMMGAGHEAGDQRQALWDYCQAQLAHVEGKAG